MHLDVDKGVTLEKGKDAVETNEELVKFCCRLTVKANLRLELLFGRTALVLESNG